MGKISENKKKIIWGTKTMELRCNGKNLESSISQIFLDQIDFSHKTDHLSLVLLYMWVKYELI